MSIHNWYRSIFAAFFVTKTGCIWALEIFFTCLQEMGNSWVTVWVMESRWEYFSRAFKYSVYLSGDFFVVSSHLLCHTIVGDT